MYITRPRRVMMICPDGPHSKHVLCRRTHIMMSGLLATTTLHVQLPHAAVIILSPRWISAGMSHTDHGLDNPCQHCTPAPLPSPRTPIAGRRRSARTGCERSDACGHHKRCCHLVVINARCQLVSLLETQRGHPEIACWKKRIGPANGRDTVPPALKLGEIGLTSARCNHNSLIFTRSTNSLTDKSDLAATRKRRPRSAGA